MKEQKAKCVYVDASVLLFYLLREGEADWSEIEGDLATSEITEVECRRAIDRIRLLERIPDEEVADRLNELRYMLDSIHVIQLSRSILTRAKAPFPTVVRTMDAIHLATAELSQSPAFMTRDRQQSVAAKAMGLEVLL